MKLIPLGSTGLQVPAVAVGCMRIIGLDKPKAQHFLKTALEHGANFFDHADCYGGGQCEALFADALEMNDDLREKIFIQTKCGNVDNPMGHWMYNFDKEHILEAVEGSLRRLKTDYIDVLLLHRPDPFMQPEEIAEAFDKLHSEGKVRYFGVSNQNVAQMKLLQKYLKQPLMVDQVQMGVAHTGIIDHGLYVNMELPYGTDRDGGLYEHCRMESITLQAWSPFRYGPYCEELVIDNPRFQKLNDAMELVATNHGVTKNTVALAWLTALPAHIQPVTGTMNEGRLVECLKAGDIQLSREEWYYIYGAAGHHLA